MTFLEKLKREHPERAGSAPNLVPSGCPQNYGYEQVSSCFQAGGDCFVCWNREMPEAEAENAEPRCNKKAEELYAYCIKTTCDECPAAGIVGIDEVCEFSDMPEKKLDEFLEAIHAAEKKTETEATTIKDSGNRREFETGAVRDMQEGKGRMDLLPWAAIIEVSKHCENGAKKYGEHNVDKGIPLHSLCDSAARHLAKFMDGQIDEPHLLAAAWNLLWAVQMRLKKPEMCDVPWKEETK